MNYEIVTTEDFDKKVKSLAKKYREQDSISKQEIEQLKEINGLNI